MSGIHQGEEALFGLRISSPDGGSALEEHVFEKMGDARRPESFVHSA
jgi:hypothetical protein